MRVECTLCFSDSSGDYYRHAYVVLSSVFANTHEKVRVHIISDETLHNRHDLFSGLCAQYGHEILFYDAPDIPGHIMDKIPDYLGRGSLYRFFIHDLIEVDKIIYLDCDVVCERDIGDLFRIDLGDRSLAVRRDERGEAYHRRNRTPYLDPAGYYNSGVLLMNLQKIRAISPTLNDNVFLNKCAEIAGTFGRGKTIEFPDQDVLNALFREDRNDVLFLDESFNFFPVDYDFANHNDLSGKIIHFLGAKPWGNILYPHHLLYWKYAQKAPWGQDIFDRIIRTQQEQTYCMLHFAQKHRKFWRWERDVESQGFWEFLKRRWNKHRKRD